MINETKRLLSKSIQDQVVEEFIAGARQRLYSRSQTVNE
jgi:hypothetical protein